jgi:hypothetical protein
MRCASHARSAPPRYFSTHDCTAAASAAAARSTGSQETTPPTVPGSASSGPTRGTRASAFQVSQLVRSRDYEGSLLCSYMPSQAARRAALAIRAYNIELLSVKDSSRCVLSPRVTLRCSRRLDIRQMRMQWWRDTLDLIYQQKAPEGHPVAMVTDFPCEACVLICDRYCAGAAGRCACLSPWQGLLGEDARGSREGSGRATTSQHGRYIPLIC